MASDQWESYQPPPFLGYSSQAALDQAYKRFGFGPAGGGFVDLVAGFAPIVLPVFPALAPFVTAATVVVTGKISPTTLFKGASALMDYPDDFGSFDPGGDFTPIDDTTPSVEILQGGADVNLGTVGQVVGALGGGSGNFVRTGGAAAALGGAALVGGGLALRMSQVVAGAILKLKQAMGGGGFLTAGGIASWGAKTWEALTSWAVRNPGLSVISTLVGLGLTVEEAAHFLAWGATRKRRKRRRGISYRDMRTTRRTMSRVLSMSAQLRALCGAAPRHYGRHRHQVVNLPRRR